MQSLPIVARSGQISFLWAYGAMTPDIRSALQRFWINSGAIADYSEAWKRSFEVGCIAVGQDWNIVGVSSFYMNRLRPDSAMYWMYRTFVDNAHRRTQVGTEIFTASYEQLAHYYRTEHGAPAGVAAIIENAVLELPGSMKRMESLGLQRLGADEHGRSIWHRPFDAGQSQH